MLTSNDLRGDGPRLAEHVVACLCAAWCRTCTGYATAFAGLAQRFPEYSFVWIDIDHDEAIIGDLDVETFPTVLVGRRDEVVFGGVLLPHIEHLERLLATLDDRTPLPTATADGFNAVLRALRGS